MNIEIISKEDTIEGGYLEVLKFKEKILEQEIEKIRKLQEKVSESIKIENFPTIDKFVCPLCGHEINRSDYLSTIFVNDKYAEWAANLVTHYRHSHIRYYDLTWRNWRYANKNPEYQRLDTHVDFKEIVNNRAKRQLIRAIKKNFPNQTAACLIYSFLKLQSNDEKTVELIRKNLITFQRGDN